MDTKKINNTLKEAYERIQQYNITSRLKIYLMLLRIVSKNYTDNDISVFKDNLVIMDNLVKHAEKLKNQYKKIEINKNKTEMDKLKELEKQLEQKHANLIYNLMKIHDILIYLFDDSEVDNKKSLHSILKGVNKFTEDELFNMELINFMRNTLSHNINLNVILNLYANTNKNSETLNIFNEAIIETERTIINYCFQNKDHIHNRYLKTLEEARKIMTNVFGGNLEPEYFEF